MGLLIQEKSVMMEILQTMMAVIAPAKMKYVEMALSSPIAEKSVI